MKIIDNNAFRDQEKIEDVLHRLEVQLEECDSMFKVAQANRMSDALFIDNKEWIALDEAESNCLLKHERIKDNRDEDYAKEAKRLRSQYINKTDNWSTPI